jgi:hypothetical protein
MGPLPDNDNFSARRFAPLRSTLWAPKGEGMGLSFILSAGAGVFFENRVSLGQEI